MTDEQAEQLLTYDEAVAMLPDGDAIHTFLNPAGILIGADWSRNQVLSLLASTDRCEVAGPQAAERGHGLVAWDDDRPVFIATRKAEAAR
jgi:hypothetical protein